MSLKRSGPTTEWREIDRWDHGVGWIAYPDEAMERASHALEVDGDVWVVDPVDVDGLDDLLAEFGEVAGVVTLLDRHKRDADVVANRHDVDVHVPNFMDGVTPEIDASVQEPVTELGDTGYGIHVIRNNRFWQEAALYGEDTETLVVPESVGTSSYFLANDEALGVHPALRLFPPNRLERLSPERILVGHGSGVREDAPEKLQHALDGARRRAPSLYLETARRFLFD